MATFNADNAAVARYGRWVSAGGGVYFQLVHGSEAVFVVNATDCTLRVQSGYAQGFKVSVDGAAFDNPTLSGTDTPVDLVVLSGASAGDHTIVLKCFEGAASYVVITNFITATGGTATIRAAGANDGLGYGPYAILGGGHAYLDPGSWQEQTADNHYSSPNNYYNNKGPGNGLYSDCQWRVKGRGAKLKMWCYKDGSKFAWYADGVKQGTFDIPNDAEWGFYEIASGLSQAADHIYTVQTRDQPNDAYMDAVMLVGSSAAFAASIPSQSGIAGFGDSITGASVGTGPDSTIGYINLLGLALGYTPFNRGIGGNTVQSGLGIGTAMEDRTADITSISPEPAEIIILPGTNDLTIEGNGSTPTMAFGAAFQSVLSDIVAGTTASKIRVVGILPRNGFSAGTLTAWNGAGNGIQGSIAAVGSGRITYIDPTTFNLVIADDFSDGLHPDASGYVKITAGIQAVISPSSPASGNAGQFGFHFNFN